MDSFKVDPTRKKILSRFQSRITSKEEFDFDMLSAPPICSLFSYQDIQELYNISSSTRLSGNPKKKKAMVNQIMAKRGFKFKASGTNRVTYTFSEDHTFLAKIAFDKVGREANINEFKNMLIFKPYVTKIFEVDPTGTLQICECVENIKTKLSYESIKPYVDILRRKWFFGEYVWSDIGDDAFMNFGIRSTGNFGVVLLDYPTCTKLDPKKCKCNQLLPDGTFCCGDIAIDSGFNRLICTKCGYEYKVSEVGKNIQNKDIIVEGSTTKMGDLKFVMTGGDRPAPKQEPIPNVPKPSINYENKYAQQPGSVLDVPTPKFVMTKGKARHNNNPKVRIPVERDDRLNKKGYDRGYVKDNSQRNNGYHNNTKNGGQRDNNQSNKNEYIDLHAYDSLKTKYEELKQELELAKNELFTAEENNVNLIASYKKLSEEAAENSNSMKEYLDQINNLQSEITERDSSIIDLNNKIKELEDSKETTTNNSNIEELNKQIEELKQKLTVSSEIANTVKNNLKIRDEAYAKLLEENNELKSQSQKITEDKVVVDRKEYNDTLNSINDMTDTIESMTMEASSLKSELGDAQHLIDRLQQKINNLESQISDKDTEMESLETELKKYDDVQIFGENNQEDFNYAYKNEHMCTLPAKLLQVKDFVEDSDSEDYVLVLNAPSDDEEFVYDTNNNIYVVDSIGGVSINDLTIISNTAMEKLKALAVIGEEVEKRKENDDKVSE